MLAAVILVSGVLGRGTASLVFHPTASPHVWQLTVVDPYAMPADVPVDWYKGNLHASSTTSIGKDLPRELGAYYASHGYGFLGIADANTYTWVEAYGSRRLTGIPMVDATYPFGDVLALYMDHWVPADSLQGAVDWITQDAGLAVLSTATILQLTPAELRGLHGVFALEIYDGRLDLASKQPDTTQQWDQLLTAGTRVYAVAADDVRSLKGDGSPAAEGRGWIAVLATDPSLESLLGSIRQGAFYASTGPRFESFRVTQHTICATAQAGSSLRFLARQAQLVGSGASSACYTLTGREGYVRVEAWDGSGGRAWSQPFYLDWS